MSMSLFTACFAAVNGSWRIAISGVEMLKLAEGRGDKQVVEVESQGEPVGGEKDATGNRKRREMVRGGGF